MNGLVYNRRVMATAILPTSIQPRSPKSSFQNEPFTDFKAPDNARKMRAALDLVASQLGREYDLLIGGERLKTEGKIRSLNPARPAQVVGIHQKAGADHAEKAMQAALGAFEVWRRASTGDRVSLLLGAAEIIRQRKFEFCGDSALEFSFRDHGGDDRGGNRDWQYGDSEAVERLANDCGQVC